MDGLGMDSATTNALDFSSLSAFLGSSSHISPEAVVPEVGMYSDNVSEDFDLSGFYRQDTIKPSLHIGDIFNDPAAATHVTHVTHAPSAVLAPGVKAENEQHEQQNEPHDGKGEDDHTVDQRLERVFPMEALRMNRKDFSAWRKTYTNSRVRNLSPRETKRLSAMRRVILARVYAERARTRKGKETKETQSRLAKVQAENAGLRKRLLDLEKKYELLLTKVGGHRVTSSKHV